MELRRYFNVRHVFLLVSGKAALATILESLKFSSTRRQVVVPAYTCYSVPSAVHKAGLDVVLCDVDASRMDYNLSELRAAVNPQTLAVVAPHLLGCPADVEGIKAIAASAGAVVIEDAAQSMGGQNADRLLGTQGDVGFFSLGRGKNVSSGSGGIIVTNSDALAEGIRRVYDRLRCEPISGILANAIAVLATKALIHPRLYWLPAGLPFLGLGETKYDPKFPVYRMDGLRAGLLTSWKKRLEESNACRAETRRLFQSKLSARVERPIVGRSAQSVQLRFPVFMPSAGQKAAIGSVSREEGLGVSAMYPEPVSRIPVLYAENPSKRFMGAETLAARLVTLPLHQYVSASDVERIAHAVNRLSGSDAESPVPACQVPTMGASNVVDLK